MGLAAGRKQVSYQVEKATHRIKEGTTYASHRAEEEAEKATNRIREELQTRELWMENRTQAAFCTKGEDPGSLNGWAISFSRLKLNLYEWEYHICKG